MAKLEKKSIEWALDSVCSTGDSFLFPMPFELHAFKDLKSEIINHVKNIELAQYKIGDYRTAICPKSSKGFRIATQLDPIDSIISHAILYEIWEEIENARIPIDQKIVYSFRLKPDSTGRLFRNDVTFQNFRSDILTEIAKTKCKYVLETDISDFYPSIYMHDVESVLSEKFSRSRFKSHVDALRTICDVMHLHQTHKGIPVGPQFSRPIAELVLDGIDRALIEGNIKFKRYVDDFVFFCNSENEAYATLSRFAQIVFEMRGLKLNESKTKILTSSDYKKKYAANPVAKAKLREVFKLEKLLNEAGIEVNSYDEIDINSLPDPIKKKIRAMNFRSMLEEELANDTPDMSVVAFIINNLARLDDPSLADILLETNSLRKLTHKLQGIIRYLLFVKSFDGDKMHGIGAKILRILNESFISEIPFNRIWLVSLFSDSDKWNNINALCRLFDHFKDGDTRREVLIAIKASGETSYIQSIKHMELAQLDPWTRRSFIYAMSNLPKEQKRPWFKAIGKRTCPFTEEIIAKWLKDR